MTPDQINAAFELIAGFLITFNVVKLYRDKKTRGVSIVPLAFMVLWGCWNCYFYPSLGVMWSFWCGLICTTVNGVWICQMFYYKRRERWRNYTFQYANTDAGEMLEVFKKALKKKEKK